jgi:hypothetical protein
MALTRTRLFSCETRISSPQIRRFYYESHEQLRRHLADFILAYNFGRRLKTLKGLTPYEFICKARASNPERLSINPLQQMPGLTSSVGLLIPSFPALNVEVVTVLRPLVIIFNSDDVVFAEIAAGLHLN